MTSSPAAQPTTAAPATPSRRRWLTLAIVGIAQLMVVLDATVVNIALPSAQADIGFSDGDKLYTMRSFQLRTHKR